MTRPAFASQLLQRAPRADKLPSILTMLKAAAAQPPTDAAAVTRLFLQLATAAGSIGKQHTTHPGWRAMVLAINTQVATETFTAEQAVTLVSAAGLIGQALPAGTITQRVSSQLINRVGSAHSAFPASACASFMQGLAVLRVPPEACNSAADAFLAPWLQTLTHHPPKQMKGYPAELLGVLAACVKHAAQPREIFLMQAGRLGGENILNEGYDLGVWRRNRTHHLML